MSKKKKRDSKKPHKTKMQRNAYLDALGLSPEQYGTNWRLPENKKEAERWEKQRERYGLDERECWQLDETFAEWLYCHLMRYLKDADRIVDLDFEPQAAEWGGRSWTQREAIDYILAKTAAYIKKFETETYQEETGIIHGMQDALHLWAEIFPYMWW